MGTGVTDSGGGAGRRRWRWLLVVLFPAAACVWLMSNNGRQPAELVGRWRHSKNPGYRKEPLPDFVLRADGSGDFVHAKGRDSMTWWADGPLVVMRHDGRSVAESVQFAMSDVNARIRNTGWRRPQVRLYVTSLSPARMVFSRIEPVEWTRDSSDPEELLIRVEE
jgi:hypothetical protein